jgi:hypothetical protein
VCRNNNLIYISNKMQYYIVYFIWKLLYMFRVVPSNIIRSGNNYLQHLSLLYERSKLHRNVGISGQIVMSQNTFILIDNTAIARDPACCVLWRKFKVSADEVNFVRRYWQDNVFSYRGSRALNVSEGWNSTGSVLELSVGVASLTTRPVGWRGSTLRPGHCSDT